ncbi:MBL fold metallo-hydrolase [Archangium sp.]|uniref:MBL fold metallo-hydrolase n=1 Tax=Archangium sp. TaxID=1872627 RepID=UPI002D2A0D70|nr:MBL fold metallo-hydrolase [Archangium sp.]HYO56756.1 MBL fold metallo-hydrolase [Archangium sp.]
MSSIQAPPNRHTPPSNIRPSDSQVNDLRLVPVEIAPDTFWVGRRDPGNIFYANPYLRRFRGTDPKTGRPNEFNLLIDPGSSSDFATVSTKVTSLIGGLERLSAVFINHQDPDVGSSASIISARYAPKAGILCSEDTWRLIVHQNLPRGRFIATEKFSHGLNVPTGHRLLPVPSPFCHFRGAVMLYDPETRVLFTGDLFGGITDVNAQGLWADESDWNGIRAFHQIYMPVNLALQRVVAVIRKLEPAVEIIAPQHGRLIRGPLIQTFLDRMEKLPVGLDIMDEAQDRSRLQAWNTALERVLTLARGYLGGSVDEKLMGSTELAETARVQSGQVSIQRMGQWTVEHVVELLCRGEPPEIAGPIMMEATTAAAEYNLPTPHLDIEGNGVASNVSLLVE